MATFLCDSSSLISLSNSCLYNIFYHLRAKFDCDFIITPSVYSESVIKPLQIREYSFSAHTINQLVKDGVVRIEEHAGLVAERDKLMSIANNLVFIGDKPLKLIQRGEAEALAYGHGINLLIDERTTRMLVENPGQLIAHLRDEFRAVIQPNEQAFGAFKRYTRDMTMVRSTELLLVAYESGFFDRFRSKSDVLRAALYKLKYSGCSISFEEIDNFFTNEKTA